jgi:putative chitobiose transport system permease protein
VGIDDVFRLWVFFTLQRANRRDLSSPQLFLRAPILDNATSKEPITRLAFLPEQYLCHSVWWFQHLFTALAAYPLAKMKFRGRDAIFYMLLATYIVPPVLTSIPGFYLAVRVFHYYDKVPSVIFPYLATVLNIFLLRQAFRSVPDDLIDAGRIDGASELRIWWSIVMPVIRPSLATVAIITFVEQWNNFFWPSLMLHTRENMTLQVGAGRAARRSRTIQRGIAAGIVMTVVPIIIFFVMLQRQFIQGLTGAVKGDA